MTNDSLIQTFFLCWYALGWASIGLWCIRRGRITSCEVVQHLCGGAVFFLAGALLWIEENVTFCKTIWRRKP